ncbi:MAG: hypothetical protein HY216_13395 [Candidatus Rokubacteria bacterium]|nr:hypothetical protein [Candidatus Rokubacteria bacterium]
MTLDDVRARVRAAGLTIAEDRLAMVAKLLGDGRAGLAAVDAPALRDVEPAVRFAIDLDGPWPSTVSEEN